MDAKLRSWWSAKATLAGFAPQAPVAVAAIAALPVLPTLSSTATAEAGRAAGSGTPEARMTGREPGGAASAVQETTLVTLGEAVRVQGGEGHGAAPVRVSDFAPARDQSQDAPACRASDNAALGTLPQGGAEGGERSREAVGDSAGDRPMPLPHCMIEFDPDLEDGEVVAAAPTLPQGAAASGEGGSQAAAKGQAPGAGQGVAEAPTAQAAAASPQALEPPPAELAAQPKPNPAAGQVHEAPAPITETARGVGAAVIDPLMPVETVTFGGDFALSFPAADPPQAALAEPVVAAVEAAEPAAALLPTLPLHDPDWTLIG